MKAFLPSLFLAVFLGCAHHAGDLCKEGDAFCSDGSSLVCRNGKLAAYPCAGARGCTVRNDRTVLCDQSAGANIGEPCFPEYAGRGQCSTGGLFLQCSGGTWTAIACAQGQTCRTTAAGVGCQ